MGIYQLLLGGLGIFVEIATLGTRQYFVVEFFKYSNLYSRSILILKNLWICLRITSVIFLLSLCVLLFKSDHYWLVFVLMFSQAYLNIFNEVYLMFLQFQMNFYRYNITSFAYALLQMSLVVLAVVFFKLNLLGVAVALFSAELLVLVYFVFRSKKYLSLLGRLSKRKLLDISKVQTLLKKSWLFVPSTLSLWLLVNIDQWMLGWLSSLENVGLYAFAGRFPLLFDYVLSSSLILVYTPYLYNGLRENFKMAGNRNIQLACLLLLSSFIFYYLSWVFLPLIKYVVSENFYDSLNYIPPLIFIACIRLATHLLQLTIKFKNSISFVLWSNALAALVNAALNYLWIPKYGIEGCIMATASSFALMFLQHLVFHQYLVRHSAQERRVEHAI